MFFADKSAAIRNGGCFPSTALVQTAHSLVPMSSLTPGDKVLVATPSGELRYSPVLLFLDKVAGERNLYYNIETARGKTLTLTPGHLVFVQPPAAESNPNGWSFRENGVDNNERIVSPKFITSDAPGALTFASRATRRTTFAKDVRVGDRVYTLDAATQTLVEDVVVRVSTSVERGTYAPLTSEGNIVVDGTLASCYAVVNSQTLAHSAFAPVRWYYQLKSAFAPPTAPAETIIPQQRAATNSNAGPMPSTSNSTTVTRAVDADQGVHWYARSLYSFAKYVLPKRMLFTV